MRRIATIVVLCGFLASPLAAQDRNRGRGRGDSGRIPPGHLPPPGECRVWYDNRPPGHQPPPTNCRAAERIAARDRDARVIYGDGERSGRRWERDRRDHGDDRNRRDRDDDRRAVPRDRR